MKIKSILLGVMMLLAVPVSAQQQCRENGRCDQVPWRMPVLPVLTSPTPFPTVVATMASGLIVPTPTATTAAGYYCPTPYPDSSAGSAYAPVILSRNPLAYWRLNEQSGVTAIDSSGFQRDSTYITGPRSAGPTFGNGEPTNQYDGINDVISIYNALEDNLVNANGITVSLWFYATSSASYTTNDYLMQVNGSGDVFMALRLHPSGLQALYNFGAGTQTITHSTTSSGTWHHVAFITDALSNAATLYFDGSSVGTGSNTGVWTQGLINAALVAASISGAQSLDGSMAHAAIFRSALTAGDIAAFANLSAPPPPTATASSNCYPFPGGNNTIDLDTSGVSSAVATMSAVSAMVPEVAEEMPASGFDLFAGAAQFFGIFRGLQAGDLGIFQPFIGFMFFAFFSELIMNSIGVILPIISALYGVIKRIIQLILDFIPL